MFYNFHYDAEIWNTGYCDAGTEESRATCGMFDVLIFFLLNASISCKFDQKIKDVRHINNSQMYHLTIL